MISQQRTNYINATKETNPNQNPEEVHNLSDFSDPFLKMYFETTYFSAVNDDIISPRMQVIPDSVEYCEFPQWHTEVVDSLSSLPDETNIAVPNFLSNYRSEKRARTSEPVLTDVNYSPYLDTDLQKQTYISLENLIDTTEHPFYNVTSNPLQSLFLPLNQPYIISPDLSCKLTNHQRVPYLNQTDGSKAFSTAFLTQSSTLTKVNNLYSQSRIQADGDTPKQTLLNTCQENYVPQLLSDQHILKTQTKAQMYKEIQHTKLQTSEALDSSNAERNDHNLHQLSGIRANTNQCRELTSDSVPGKVNEEILQNSMYAGISLGSTPLVHQSLSSNSKEPLSESSCVKERNITAFVSNSYKDLELETDLATAGEEPSFLNKETILRDKVIAKVVLGENSPKKRRRLRPAMCEICGKVVSRVRYLPIHMRLHSGYRPYKCSLCEKAFTQGSTLKRHQRTHSGERAYSCPSCHKTFLSFNGRKFHMLKHTGERPFKCPFYNCEKAFPVRSTLEKHTRVHTGLKPYSCSICGQRFSQNSNMNQHRKRAHKIQDGFSKAEMPSCKKIEELPEIF